jgi:CheY-like chemotaxis protein
MSKSGPVIIIEDDAEDQAIFQEVLDELKISNKVVWFKRCSEAFSYLKTTPEQPFIIFSDINLPDQSGIEFKRDLDNDQALRKKSIPFIFYSTSTNQEEVNKAYTQMTVQGFFRKGHSFKEIKDCIKVIFEYWGICKHPNAA